jgi:mannose-6-phosphate isomerase-like protein (cupin superfamily)
MTPHHLPSALGGLTALQVTATTTAAEANAALRELGRFNECLVGVIKFSGRTPWERHPGDELLYVVSGVVEVTVLLDDDRQVVALTEGMVMVIPRDRWHRQEPRPETSIMFLTPAQETDASWADDPRRG